jgi:YgiT-type zinc finger domain-containing protein
MLSYLVPLPGMKKKKIMICDNCGKEGATIRRITRNYGKGGKLLVIENVPVVNCSHCGESYLSAETLHEIERIKLHRNNFARKRSVAVADFT